MASPRHMGHMNGWVGIAIFCCAAVAGQAADRIRATPVPPELHGFAGELEGKFLQHRGPLFWVQITRVRHVAEGNRAKAPKSAVDLTLIFDLKDQGRVVKPHFDAVKALPAGERIRIKAQHKAGGRLAVLAPPTVVPPNEEPEAVGGAGKPGGGSAGGGSSFFGISIEGGAGVDPKLLASFRRRVDAAAADARAGRLQPALDKVLKIKAELPADLKADGIERSIAHLQQQIAQGKQTKSTMTDINARIQDAVRDENDGDFESALKKFMQIKADLPENVKASGLDDAIARLEKKIKDQPHLVAAHRELDRAEEAEREARFDDALAIFEAVRKSLPPGVDVQRLADAEARVKAKQKYAPLLESLARRMDRALQLETDGKYAESLAEFKKIRADMPKDAALRVDTAEIDRAIARVSKLAKEGE